MLKTQKTPYCANATTRTVRIATNEAVDVETTDTGKIVHIEIPARTLTNSERAALRDLFPNTGQGVERLLDTEAILSAIT